MRDLLQSPLAATATIPTTITTTVTVPASVGSTPTCTPVGDTTTPTSPICTGMIIIQPAGASVSTWVTIGGGQATTTVPTGTTPTGTTGAGATDGATAPTILGTIRTIRITPAASPLTTITTTTIRTMPITTDTATTSDPQWATVETVAVAATVRTTTLDKTDRQVHTAMARPTTTTL